MPYKLPQKNILLGLKLFLNAYKDTFQRSLKNKDILLLGAFRRLRQQLETQQASAEVVIGALVYTLSVLQPVKNQHAATEAKAHTKKKSPGQNALARAILTFLNISQENVMDEQSAAVYLTAFYQYLKDRAAAEELAESKAVAPAAIGRESILLSNPDEFTLVERPLVDRVAEYIRQKLAILIEQEPSAAKLADNLLQLVPSYQESSASRLGIFGSSEQRERALVFLRLVHTSLGKQSAEAKEITLARQQHAIRVGALVCVATGIADEYKTLSPTRSNLFVRCMEALNCSDINVIPKERLLHVYSQLLSLLLSLRQNDSINQGAKIRDFIESRSLSEAIDFCRKQIERLLLEIFPAKDYQTCMRDIARKHEVQLYESLNFDADRYHEKGDVFVDLTKCPYTHLLPFLMSLFNKDKPFTTMKVIVNENSLIVMAYGQALYLHFKNPDALRKLQNELENLGSSKEMVLEDTPIFIHDIPSLPKELLPPAFQEKAAYCFSSVKAVKLDELDGVAPVMSDKPDKSSSYASVARVSMS